MYRIGKVSEMKQIKGKIPVIVYQEVLRIVTVLDKYYGKDRIYTGMTADLSLLQRIKVI